MPPLLQASLEEAYKKELDERFGIRFDSLFTITNMPISRFGSVLPSKGQFYDYILLKSSYSESNLQNDVCRSLISIDWQGFVFDCDFNQMLDLPLIARESPLYLADLLKEDLLRKPIRWRIIAMGAQQGKAVAGGPLGGHLVGHYYSRPE